MYHYYQAVTNKTGDALSEYRVRLRQAATPPGSGVVATIYADNSGTPIISVSGIADTAIVDDDGNVSFFVDDGTYDIEISDNVDVPYKIVPYVPMYAGPSFNSREEASDDYTVADTDYAYRLDCTSATDVDLHLPDDKPAGFWLSVLQVGSGRVTAIADGGGTFTAANGFTSTYTEGSLMFLFVRVNGDGSSAEWYGTGDMA